MTGRGILIVEDEVLISMCLEDVLHDWGYDVVGISPTLDDAFEKLSSTSFSAAVLDINLGRDLVWPFARALMGRGIGFAFLSSDCERDDFPADLAGAHRMCKPFEEERLQAVISSLVLPRCA